MRHVACGIMLAMFLFSGGLALAQDNLGVTADQLSRAADAVDTAAREAVSNANSVPQLEAVAGVDAGGGGDGGDGGGGGGGC